MRNNQMADPEVNQWEQEQLMEGGDQIEPEVNQWEQEQLMEGGDQIEPESDQWEQEQMAEFSDQFASENNLDSSEVLATVIKLIQMSGSSIEDLIDIARKNPNTIIDEMGGGYENTVY